MLIFEILPALMFILSSGLLFNERFRSNTALVTITGIVALVASYFLFEQIADRVINSRLDARLSPSSQPTSVPQQPTGTVPADESRGRTSPAPPPVQVTETITRQEIEGAFRTYIAAWQSGDITTQANLLDASFTYIDQQNVRQSRASYLQQKIELAKKYGASPLSSNIRIGVSNVAIETRGEYGTVSYDQDYQSPYYSSFGRNKFVMRKANRTVRIVEEVFNRQRVGRGQAGL